VGFGGISVGGIAPTARPGRGCCYRASTTCRTRNESGEETPSRAARRRHGAQLADELERLVMLHDASNIAAVIVEPIAGSAVC